MAINTQDEFIPDPPFGKRRNNVFSQFGEDGILDFLLKSVNTNNGYFVEFGAWDGQHLSNCSNLAAQGWHGCFIEGDKLRFNQLCANYMQQPFIKLINNYVLPTGQQSLDSILKKIGAPKHFDLLSIDVDGNDYHIWAALDQYLPNICIVEFNPTIPATVEYVQPSDPTAHIGNSLLSLWKLAQKKGYQLVAATEINAFFMLNKLCIDYQVKTYSPAQLKNPKYEMQVFQAYDGTLIFNGMTTLLWHGVEMREDKCQTLPLHLRKFPDGQDTAYFEQLEAFKASVVKSRP